MTLFGLFPGEAPDSAACAASRRSTSTSDSPQVPRKPAWTKSRRVVPSQRRWRGSVGTASIEEVSYRLWGSPRVGRFLFRQRAYRGQVIPVRVDDELLLTQLTTRSTLEVCRPHRSLKR